MVGRIGIIVRAVGLCRVHCYNTHAVRGYQAVVSTRWLRDQLMTSKTGDNASNIQVLDCSWKPSKDVNGYKDFYMGGHIPQSLYFDLNRCVDSTPQIPRNIPNSQCFVEYIKSLGITAKTHVIVYDRFTTLAASRLWFLFRLFGHDKVSILDGGLVKWVEDGFQTTLEEKQVERSDYQLKLNSNMLRDFQAMQENLRTKKEQVVDGREEESFIATVKKPKEKCDGHIPGSKNVPFEDLFKTDLTFKSKEELAELFESANVDLERPMVTMCLTGMTACGLVAAAHICGKKDIPIYYGSWMEWRQRANEDQCITNCS